MKADSFCLESFLDCMQPSGTSACVSVAARYLPFPLIANATVAANLRYTLLTPRLAPFEPVISNADCSIEYLLISIPISKWNGQSKPKSLASLQQRYEF